jgi:branched-chain amino acid transport system substrate-binding protein
MALRSVCQWQGAIVLVLFGALPMLIACSPQTPVYIGFMGGLTDRTSDTAEAGRNGLMLAVEQRNLEGGIHGRRLEIVFQDDGQNADMAGIAIAALVAAQVDVVIGPFTSAMAKVALPIADKAQLTLISPVVTSLDFLGKDDSLIRLSRTTRDNGQHYAQHLLARGQRRVAVAYDIRNRSYSESWLKAFTQAYTAQGGVVCVALPFESQANMGFGDVIRTLLTPQPDSLLFVASAIDVARLAQQASKLAPELPQSAAEWAATEALIELGGNAVNGMVLAQSYDRTDKSARHLEFRDAYVNRFARVPSFVSVAAYDTATVLFQALERRQPGESVKAAVLNRGPYHGVQQRIVFDRFGDTVRDMYFTEIRGGQFVPVK